jgi:hypothetical protein
MTIAPPGASGPSGMFTFSSAAMSASVSVRPVNLAAIMALFKAITALYWT